MRDDGRDFTTEDETRETDDEVIARLAKLKPLDYARQLGEAAKKLGIKPASALNRLVEASRLKAGNGAPNTAPASGLPRLQVRGSEPDQTVAALRDAFAATGKLYDRGTPVRLAFDLQQGCTMTHMLSAEGIIREAHGACRPYAIRATKDGLIETDVALPKGIALMYLDWRGEWRLPPLDGITSAPLLREDGGIRTTQGYDAQTGFWCENIPDLGELVPEHPSDEEAAAALLKLRSRFRTFPFADAVPVRVEGINEPVVDISIPPGADESSFLTALLTAVCRASLRLSPAVLLRGAEISGAGTGKGLLARIICAIAFGFGPAAVTWGGDAKEFDKRIGAELMKGGPVMFMDNINGQALRSDALSSAITERPCSVRVLGKSLMVMLNATAFIVLTGNALDVSGDLARRFLQIELDARCEDPEAREFKGDILAEAIAQRSDLLAACLTIWRWGRQKKDLKTGLPLGSFEQWARWVRDPLLALGCRDAAKRVSEAKLRDRRRVLAAEVFNAWWTAHRSTSIAAAELAESVTRLLDPQGRGRQFVAAAVSRLAGTRVAGYALTAQPPVGKWGPTSYQLTRPDQEKFHQQTGGDPKNIGVIGGIGTSNAGSPPYDPYDPYDSGATPNSRTKIFPDADDDEAVI